MYWNIWASHWAYNVTSWIVTLDVLKSFCILGELSPHHRWIVTLDVLKFVSACDISSACAVE